MREKVQTGVPHPLCGQRLGRKGGLWLGQEVGVKTEVGGWLEGASSLNVSRFLKFRDLHLLFRLLDLSTIDVLVAGVQGLCCALWEV